MIEAEIRDYLLEKIRNHEFQENQKLPSENELASFFGTTRNRVRNVYQTLVSMGYISSKHGIGHYPRGKLQSIELALRGDQSFSEKMKEQGMDYLSKNIHCQLIYPEKHNDRVKELADFGAVYEVCRLRIVEKQPVALHYSYVSEKVFPTISRDGAQITSMFQYYREKGYQRFNSTEKEISVTFPSLEEQKLLQCEELVPLLMLETDCYDQVTNQLLEITKVIYRSDLFTYKIT